MAFMMAPMGTIMAMVMTTIWKAALYDAPYMPPRVMKPTVARPATIRAVL